MNIRPYILYTLGLVALLSACSPKDEEVEPKYFGPEQISRIELSPNGPQLIRNGQNELSFALRCYYYADEARTQEVLYPADRLPLDDISITSSDGQTLKASESYRTRSTEPSISFTAKLGSISSQPTSVELIDPERETYTKIRVPVSFTAIYAPTSAIYADSLRRDVLEGILARANKVFSGELAKGPSSGNAQIEFYFHSLNRVPVASPSDYTSEKLKERIKTSLMGDSHRVLQVWVLSTSTYNDLRSTRIAPAFTLGNPDDLRGLTLAKATSVNTSTRKITVENSNGSTSEKDIEPVNAGIITSFADLYQNSTGYTEHRFEQLLGRFYGLLPTGLNNSRNNYNGRDADHCADTYTYNSSGVGLLKQVLQVGSNVQPLFYKSYNVMDAQSATTTLSQAQVKRIRQVIKDCPYRQQGQ